jgi:hypothetical protein
MALRILLACIEVNPEVSCIISHYDDPSFLLVLLAVTCDPPQALYSSCHISAHGFLHQGFCANLHVVSYLWLSLIHSFLCGTIIFFIWFPILSTCLFHLQIR